MSQNGSTSPRLIIRMNKRKAKRIYLSRASKLELFTQKLLDGSSNHGKEYARDTVHGMYMEYSIHIVVLWYLNATISFFFINYYLLFMDCHVWYVVVFECYRFFFFIIYYLCTVTYGMLWYLNATILLFLYGNS